MWTKVRTKLSDWMIMGLVLDGTMMVGTFAFFWCFTPDRLESPLAKEIFMLLGGFFLLVVAFHINRRGNQKDFFYQKQIEAVMAYYSQLRWLGFSNSEDLKHDVNFILERYPELIFGPSFYLIARWGLTQPLDLDEACKIRDEISSRPDVQDRIPKYILELDHEVKLLDIMILLTLLIVHRLPREAADLATSIGGAILRSLDLERGRFE